MCGWVGELCGGPSLRAPSPHHICVLNNTVMRILSIFFYLTKTVPVAFTVRANIEFDGLLNGLDAPLPHKVISFTTKEFLQIKKRFDQHWWIGRVVRENSPFGFIPSSAKMEILRHSMQSNLSQLILSEALNAAAAANQNAADGHPSSTNNPSNTTGKSTIGGRCQHLCRRGIMSLACRRSLTCSACGFGPDMPP